MVHVSQAPKMLEPAFPIMQLQVSFNSTVPGKEHIFQTQRVQFVMHTFCYE